LKLATAFNDPNAYWIVIPIQRLMLEILFSTTDSQRKELKEVLQLLSDQPQVLVYGKMIHEVASMMLDMLAEIREHAFVAGAQLTVGIVKCCLMLKVDEDLIEGAKKCFLAGVEIYKHCKANERMKMVMEVSPYPGVSYDDVLKASIAMSKYEGNWVISAAYIGNLTRISYCALHALQRPDDETEQDQLRILHACVIGDGAVLGLEKILGRTQRKRRAKIGVELGRQSLEIVENFFLNGESASSFLQTIVAECLGELQEAGERLAKDLLDKFKEKMEDISNETKKVVDTSKIGKEAKDSLEKALRAVKTVIKEFDDCLKVIISGMEKMIRHLQGMDKWLGVILCYAIPFMGEVDEVDTKETGCKTIVARNDSFESMQDSRKSEISTYKRALNSLIGNEKESVKNKHKSTTKHWQGSETDSELQPHFSTDGTPKEEKKTGSDEIKYLVDKVFVVRELIQETPSNLREMIDVLKEVQKRLQELSKACDDLSGYLQPPTQSTFGQNVMEPMKEMAQKTFNSSLNWLRKGKKQVDDDSNLTVVEKAINALQNDHFKYFEGVFSSEKMFAAKRVQVILQYAARAVGDLEECFGCYAEEKAVMIKIARDLKGQYQAFFSEDVVKPLLNELSMIGGQGWWKQAGSLWDTALATVGLETKDVGGALCMFREAIQTLVGPGSSPALVEEAAITAELEIEQMLYYLVNRDQPKDKDQAKGTDPTEGMDPTKGTDLAKDTDQLTSIHQRDQLSSIHQSISERIAKTKATSTSSVVQQLLLQTKYSEKVKYLFGTNWALIEHDVMSTHKSNAKELGFAEKAIHKKDEIGVTDYSFESSSLHTIEKTKVESSMKATRVALDEQKGSSTKAGISGVSSTLIMQLIRLEKKASQSRRRIINMFARKYLDEEKRVNRYRYIYVIKDGHGSSPGRLNPRHLLDRTGMTTTMPLDDMYYDDNEHVHMRHQGEDQEYPFVPTRRPRPVLSITDGTIMSTPLPRRDRESPSRSGQGSERFLYFGKGNNNRSDLFRPSSAGSSRTSNRMSPAPVITASYGIQPSSAGSRKTSNSMSPAPLTTPSYGIQPSSAGSSRTSNRMSPAPVITASYGMQPSSPGSWIPPNSVSPAPLTTPSRGERPSSAGRRRRSINTDSIALASKAYGVLPLSAGSGMRRQPGTLSSRSPRYSSSRGIIFFNGGDARVSGTGTKGAP